MATGLTRTARAVVIGGAAIVAVAVGVVAGSRWGQQPIDAAAERALTTVGLTTLDGQPARLEQWAGKTVVVNFWATWCAPCREEIPGLIEVHREIEGRNALVIGVAIDSAAKAGAYAKEAGIPYPILVGGAPTLDVLRALGNGPGGLPFTVLLDPNGRVIGQHLGLLHAKDLRRMLQGKVS